MPLLDHFQPPLRDDRPWEGFHSAWANAIVGWLNRNVLPERYWAIPQVHVGARVEIDAATFRLDEESAVPGNGIATAVWAPPQAKLAVAVDFGDADTFEVQIREGGPASLGRGCRAGQPRQQGSCVSSPRFRHQMRQLFATTHIGHCGRWGDRAAR